MQHLRARVEVNEAASQFPSGAYQPSHGCTYGRRRRRSPMCAPRLGCEARHGQSTSQARCSKRIDLRLGQKSRVAKAERYVDRAHERIGSNESPMEAKLGRSSNERPRQNPQPSLPVSSGQVSERVSLRLHPVAHRWRSKQEFATRSLRSGAWLAPMRISCRN